MCSNCYGVNMTAVLSEQKPRERVVHGNVLFALLLGKPTDDNSWSADALCSQVDPDLFFPERGASLKDAKAICAKCPVRDTCLSEALEGEERFGVWGGLSEYERRKLRRNAQ